MGGATSSFAFRNFDWLFNLFKSFYWSTNYIGIYSITQMIFCTWKPDLSTTLCSSLQRQTLSLRTIPNFINEKIAHQNTTLTSCFNNMQTNLSQFDCVIMSKQRARRKIAKFWFGLYCLFGSVSSSSLLLSLQSFAFYSCKWYIDLSSQSLLDFPILLLFI
jgi:hypothetical protein